MTLCPLSFSTVFDQGEVRFASEPCKEKECAWYSVSSEVCAVKDIAYVGAAIERMMRR